MPRIVKHLGRVDYEPTWRAMQAFTDARNADTPDELWVVEHPPVYTQGLAGKPEHLLHATAIPVVKTDRGGQITYHGPGQLVVYLLVDFKRMGIGVRELVRRIEQAVIDALAELGIHGNGDVDAPGVYVAGAKIASLGLRIKNHAVYHGLSFNVDMDLAPFDSINPCGYANLKVTDLKQLGVELSLAAAADTLLPHLERLLNSTEELT
ncbi:MULTISPECIES: lipoyl(octanoyl) transferase LipB [Chromobacterium]|uniref:Octanoyltransferase n=1 Tax=Chromobacterium haemolyticum TaxID=394935 RepID=A0ABS3GSK2_9NEIS|nr:MULTISPECIES: lipoyl(octanoyl) transferase LipB [Chromobacterium]MBN3006133.1 lipoyl(octanoyl) transferase LipB [Chromobacterium alkanivorans]KMN77359.1 lipoate--protein ligase [Chromobacterium sp. LK11]MBK0416719.1 lipoyl(octanoyl) transferase LipB [Chromobacterium haemolyticum]MBO0417939.1 lipoyl(octanoyl) transferase LipB [Chromobacterium haemolyticum]MBO0501106.1 lipoyl(octanoyl) transferase LipB [Chromobacterium haemolyticum]